MLAVDMVNAADSGHPGTPMGAADMAYVLWSKHLRYDPSDRALARRDRFVLSAGHACALHYALLHLAGFDLSDGRAAPLPSNLRFEDAGTSRSALTPGIEVTTGPLDRASRTASASPSRQAMMARVVSTRTRRRRVATACSASRRRLPHGGHLLRGRVDGGPLASRQPEGPLRQQPHLHRRLDGPRVTDDVAKRFDAAAGACCAPRATTASRSVGR